MSNRGKRKAFGVSKKKACDVHHCLKAKQTSAHSHKDLFKDEGIKHPRVQM